MMKKPKTRKTTKKPKMGRPVKFETGAKNLSVYLPEEAVIKLRQFAAAECLQTGRVRHVSDVIVEALRAHEPVRKFVEKAGERRARTWDEILGGRISELERER